MTRYDRPIWQLLGDALAELPDVFSKDDVVAWFAENRPKAAEDTVKKTVRAACVNCTPPPFQTGPTERLILYSLPNALYRGYDAKKHGLWVDGVLKTPSLRGDQT